MLLRLCLAFVLLAPSLVRAATLGIPGQGATLSGIGVISGWKCAAKGALTIRFNGGDPLPLLYGTERPDVRQNGQCLDNDHDNVGFVAVWNWARLGDGTHTAVAYDDGVAFARSAFTVVTVGEEFVRGESGQGTIRLSPSNTHVTVAWDQAQQGFTITGVVEAMETFCADGDELTRPGFRYENNVWGKGDLTDYEQCLLKRIVSGRTQYGWRWRWPLAAGNVKAYPEVIYGHKPLGHDPLRPPTTAALPRQISAINKLQVSYEVELNASGEYNLAFEMWVTSRNPPTTETITHEIMIWVDRTFEPDLPEFLVAEVPIDGVTYDLYIDPGTQLGDKYIAFASHPAQLSGTLNFEKFLAYLIAHGHLPTDQYVTSVELGNEVIQGTGELWLKHLQITVE